MTGAEALGAIMKHNVMFGEGKHGLLPPGTGIPPSALGTQRRTIIISSDGHLGLSGEHYYISESIYSVKQLIVFENSTFDYLFWLF